MTIPLIDNHGHSLLSAFRQASEAEFTSAFSESKLALQMVGDIQNSINFLQLQKRLFAVSKTASIADYLAQRNGSGAFSKKIVKELFLRAGFERILLDDSYLPDLMLPLKQFEATVGVKVSRLVRVEPVFEKLVTACATADEALENLESALFPPGDSKNIVALKTIVCYRGGLSIFEIDKDDAQANYYDCRRSVLATGRIKKSSFYHYLLLKTFDLAIKRDIPVQVHCGLGDDDADLSLSNPDLLHRLLRKSRFAQLKLVLLHCYPFQKEAAILASLYPHVYFDLSLASFLLGDQTGLYGQVLAAAPYSKILAGTDGHSQPETYFQGAMALRLGLANALEKLINEQSIDMQESDAIANAVLHGNARRLYRL